MDLGESQSFHGPHAATSDGHGKPPILESAIEALLQHRRRTPRQRRAENSLLSFSETDGSGNSVPEWVFLVVTLQRMPERLPRRPQLIPLAHSLYLSETGESSSAAPLSVCVLCPDPARPYRRFFMESPPAEWRERIKNLQVTQVLSVRQLRRDYHQFERRRQLVSAHQLFLADTRIWPMLPELLGKEFFRRKKYPLPVKFFGLESAKPIAAERIIRACERIRDSTVWYPGLAVAGAGTCCSLRVGHLAMSSAALKANVLQVLEALPSLIPGGIRRGVLSMYLKTKELVPIPVYVAARSPDTRSTTAPIASKFKLWSPEHRRSKGKLVRVPDGQMTPLQRKKYRKRGMRRRGRGEKQ